MTLDLNDLNTVLKVIGGIITVLGGIGTLLAFIFSKRKHKWKIVSLTLVIALVGGGLLWYTLNTNAQASAARAQANMWTTRVNEFAPFCQKSGNAIWTVPENVKLSTNRQCLDQGLFMTGSSTNTPAEIDLDLIDGQTYSQTKLDAEIQVTFNKQDSNTMAGLVVQTQQQGSGGYGLAINSTGYWELGDNSGNRKASHGIVTTATIFTIEIKVQQGHLCGWINGKQAFTPIDDMLNPSVGAVGLVVYGSENPLSPVIFSNFTLKL